MHYNIFILMKSPKCWWFLRSDRRSNETQQTNKQTKPFQLLSSLFTVFICAFKCFHVFQNWFYMFWYVLQIHLRLVKNVRITEKPRIFLPSLPCLSDLFRENPICFIKGIITLMFNVIGNCCHEEIVYMSLSSSLSVWLSQSLS